MLLVQHEANSFAIRPTTLGDFVVHHGVSARTALQGANSEFAGAMEALAGLGATPVPLLSAHALPAGPLPPDEFDRLVDLVTGTVGGATLDAVVLCLHGALATADGRSDADLIDAVRAVTARSVPISLTLDLHANVTGRLLADVTVATGYTTNPHTDLADTGRRGVHLLAAVLTGRLEPEIAIETCPAIFPDQSLRVPDGLLGEVVAAVLPTVPDSVVDLSVFPTQPWLDAPGIGFTTLAVAHRDRSAAALAARTVTTAVWDRRADFVVERLLDPADAVAAARASDVRPFVLTEAADAPTAGAAGDNPALLAELVRHHRDLDALITIVDPAAVERCHGCGVATEVDLVVGGAVDPRWAEPVGFRGEVVRLGDGDYRLSGVGYHGMVASMGRFAVVRHGRTTVLLTETPAWSADPGTWRHAGLDPDRCDVLAVRSCTDYLANFPAAAATSVVVDAPGCASPSLDRLPFERCGTPPYPIGAAALRKVADG